MILGLLAGVVTTAEDSASLLPGPSGDAAAPSTTTQRQRCTVRKDDDGWWFVSADGERFFSLGVCMFNQGSKKDEYDPAKPSYAALRHYDSPEAWADASLRRIKEWGFTTVGGWSDYETLRLSKEHDLWVTPVLHLGSRSGVPWFDMWDEKNVRQIDKLAKQTILTFKHEPRVLGYYSDNELGWWNAILWKMTLEQPATSGQRQRLVRLVRETYGDDWNALLEDFEPAGASNWQEIDRSGMLWLRPGGSGIQLMRRFLRLAADRYYQLMQDAIRRYDPDALYLGDRYQSFYYPEVPLAARKYVDVISTNLNVSWNDGTFLRSYLDTLHSLTGRPVLASEFYMAAVENRSGNKNLVGGFPAVGTQQERSESLAATLRSLARLPYVVGADWFQYYDEPPHGRKLDGEDYNFGLVDIHNEPYAEIVQTFDNFNSAQLKSARASSFPDASGGVPPAPIDPTGEFRFMNALKAWDRQRGFIAPDTKNPAGDLYICWTPEAIFLASYVLDIIEPDYYRDSKIPEADRAEWSIQMDGMQPIRVRVGAGAPPAIDGPELAIESLSGTYHDVRCISVVSIPAETLGRKRLRAGDTVELKSSFDTHGRAARIQWSGRFTLTE